MAPIRIAVVDDSALFRMLIRNVVAEIPDCEIVASVSDGRTAVEKIEALKPDLVTLDVEMPDMNGIEVLRALKQRRIETRVLMISRFTTAGAQVTTDALIEGAFDFIVKPSGNSPAANKATLRSDLEERLNALREGVEAPADKLVIDPPDLTATARIDAVVIGCSTGGPDALARVIPELSASLPVPVFVVQHMPTGFTATLASRLNEASELEVVEAADGMRVRAGQVVLAHGGRHMQLSRRISESVLLHLTEDPPEQRCRPAVDYTLRSAVKLFDGHLLAVILTGMGRDGTEGCQLVRSHGGRVLAQHAEGCTVYGMPKSVVTAALAHEIVRLPRIAATIERIVRTRGN